MRCRTRSRVRRSEVGAAESPCSCSMTCTRRGDARCLPPVRSKDRDSAVPACRDVPRRGAGADRLRTPGELATARADRMRLLLSEAAVRLRALRRRRRLLYRKTNGNPFFVAEALAAGLEATPRRWMCPPGGTAGRGGACAPRCGCSHAARHRALAGCATLNRAPRRARLGELVARALRAATTWPVASKRRSSAAPEAAPRARLHLADPPAGRSSARVAYYRAGDAAAAPLCARRGRACSPRRAPRGRGRVRTSPCHGTAPVGRACPAAGAGSESAT